VRRRRPADGPPVPAAACAPLTLAVFIIGVPHRIGALDAALAYILRHEGVWRATGGEIIEHYLASEATF
jgi:hypothetical protein